MSWLPIRSAMATTMARPSPLPSVLGVCPLERAVRRSRVSRGRTGPSFDTINCAISRQGHIDRRSLRAMTQRVLHEIAAQDAEGVRVEIRHDRLCPAGSARCGPARSRAPDRPPQHAQRLSGPSFGPSAAPAFGPRKLHQAFGQPGQALSVASISARARRWPGRSSPTAAAAPERWPRPAAFATHARHWRQSCVRPRRLSRNRARRLFRVAASGPISVGRSSAGTAERSRALRASSRSRNRRRGARLKRTARMIASQREGQHDQQGQAEAHLDLARDGGAMRQRFGDRDPDRPLQRASL